MLMVTNLFIPLLMQTLKQRNSGKPTVKKSICKQSPMVVENSSSEEDYIKVENSSSSSSSNSDLSEAPMLQKYPSFEQFMLPSIEVDWEAILISLLVM